MNLADLRQSLLNRAKELILQDGDISPVVFFIRDQEIVGMAPAPTELVPKEIEKPLRMRVALWTLGVMLRATPPPAAWDSVILVSTGWTVKSAVGDPVPKPPLAKHPERVEALVAVHSCGHNNHNAELIPFSRTPDGPVFEESLGKGEKVESLLLDAFWEGYKGKAK